MIEPHGSVGAVLAFSSRFCKYCQKFLDEWNYIISFFSLTDFKSTPAQVEGNQGFLLQPGKALERHSSTRLEARFPYHGSGAMTRSPSPLAWRPDFPGAPREAH